MSTPTPTYSPARRPALRSAWANAIGSAAVLVSVTAAAWWVSLPDLGAEGPLPVMLTALAAFYITGATVLAVFGGADGNVFPFALAVVATEALALATDNVPVALGVAVATVCVGIFACRLDMAQLGSEGT